MQHLLTDEEQQFADALLAQTELDLCAAYYAAGFPVIDGGDADQVRQEALELLLLPVVWDYVAETIKRPLNDRQIRFAEEYLIDLRPGSAYIRAGYQAKNPDVARSAASRLLANVNVVRYIAFLKLARSRRTQITIDRVLEEIAKVAFSNMEDYAIWTNDGVKFRNLEQMPEGAPCAISEISSRPTKYGNIRTLKLHDKVSALRLAGQHVGLFNDITEALQTFKRYGYRVRRTKTGFELTYQEVPGESAPIESVPVS